MSSDSVVLFSGGMDSLIAWEYLGRPDRLYVRMNHRYQAEELRQISELSLPGNLILSDFGELGKYEKSDAEIPLRNLYLSMVAVNLGYLKVWLAIQKDEMSIPDRTISFMHKASDLLSVLRGDTVSVGTPFEFMDKVDMVGWYVSEGKDVETLRNTWACYFPVGGKPCGGCGACFRRYVSFKENGIEPGYELTDGIRLYYSQRLGYYSDDRKKRMEKYL